LRKESKGEALEVLPIVPGHADEDVGVYARPMPTAGRLAKALRAVPRGILV